MDQMTKERMEIFNNIQKVDKSIQDTEKLLESFIPNMSRLFQEKRLK
jgi:hypothetical protein